MQELLDVTRMLLAEMEQAATVQDAAPDPDAEETREKFRIVKVLLLPNSYSRRRK